VCVCVFMYVCNFTVVGNRLAGSPRTRWSSKLLED